MHHVNTYYLLTVNTLIPYSRFAGYPFSVKISTINAAEMVQPTSGTHWQGKSCAIAASNINIYGSLKKLFLLCTGFTWLITHVNVVTLDLVLSKSHSHANTLTTLWVWLGSHNS